MKLSLSRSQLEELCAGMKAELRALLEKVVAAAAVRSAELAKAAKAGGEEAAEAEATAFTLSSAELVGGGMRVPWVQAS